uniref:Secreted protein n=1 Tax=Anopheles darlingi TaxID=43151 RepID=A0A2M4D6T6_ANODA
MICVFVCFAFFLMFIKPFTCSNPFAPLFYFFVCFSLIYKFPLPGTFLCSSSLTPNPVLSFFVYNDFLDI